MKGNECEALPAGTSNLDGFVDAGGLIHQLPFPLTSFPRVVCPLIKSINYAKMLT
jgi:hypothetical protein